MNSNRLKTYKRQCDTVKIDKLIKMYESELVILGTVQQTQQAQIGKTQRRHKTDIKQS